MRDLADAPGPALDRCMARVSLADPECPPNGLAELFTSRGYSPILERIMHFTAPRDVLSVAWTCKSSYTTICTSVRIQLSLQKWAHNLPPTSHFAHPLRELERVLRWQTHLSRLLPQRVDSFILPVSSGMPRLKDGYALLPRREDGTPGWPTGCDVIQLPRSGEDLLEERAARDKYLQAKARAEAGEGEMPAPLEQRDVWRIEFPYEAVTVDYDPGSNLLVQANIIHVEYPARFCILSGLRLSFWRLNPRFGPDEQPEHPEAKYAVIDIGSDAFTHPWRPLRKPHVHVGRNGLIIIVMRNWHSSNCVMVLDWRRGVMRGASWHEQATSWQFLDDDTVIGSSIQSETNLYTRDREPLDVRASRVYGGQVKSDTPLSPTSSPPPSPAGSDKFFDALEEQITEDDDANEPEPTDTDQEWLTLVARSLGDEQEPEVVEPSRGVYMVEGLFPLGAQTVLRFPKLRRDSPPHATDGPSSFHLTGSLIEMDNCPRPDDAGLVLILCWGQLDYVGLSKHRHRGVAGTVPSRHMIDTIAKHRGGLVEFAEWGAQVTLQATDDAYVSVGTNKVFHLTAEPLPEDPARLKRRARAKLLDFSPLAVHRVGQVVSRSLGSIGRVSDAEIDADVSSVSLHDAPLNEDEWGDKMCDGNHGLPPGITQCPVATPPVMHRQSLKGFVCTGGATLDGAVFDKRIERSGTPFSMRSQEMDVDAGHLLEDVWFDGQRLVLIYGCRMDILTF